MDDETKNLLADVCEIIYQTTDRAFRAHEMAWRTYGVLRKRDSGFVHEHEAPTGVQFDEMLQQRDDQLERLRALIESLRKGR